MKRLIVLSCLVPGVVFTTGPASARPVFGRDCSECHTGGAPAVPNALQVVGHDGWANPDESATGAPDRGFLKYFLVQAGGTVDLQVQVDFDTLEDIYYAVELKRTEVPGVEVGGHLADWDGETITEHYTADPDWFRQEGFIYFQPDKPYYTNSLVDGIPYSEPATWTFTITIGPDVLPDFYDLEFAIAGVPDYFYTDEHFYLQVIPEPASALLFLQFGAAAFMTRRRRRE